MVHLHYQNTSKYVFFFRLINSMDKNYSVLDSATSSGSNNSSDFDSILESGKFFFYKKNLHNNSFLCFFLQKWSFVNKHGIDTVYQRRFFKNHHFIIIIIIIMIRRASQKNWQAGRQAGRQAGLV